MFPTFYIKRGQVLISTSTFNFSAITDCTSAGSTVPTIISKSVDSGVTLPTDLVEITWNTSGTYDGYSVWGRLNWSPSFPTNSGSFAGCNVLRGDNLANGIIYVGKGGGTGPSPAGSYYTAADAEAAFVASQPYYLTGFNRYRFFIQDSPCGDNAGGVSIIVKIYR